MLCDDVEVIMNHLRKIIALLLVVSAGMSAVDLVASPKRRASASKVQNKSKAARTEPAVSAISEEDAQPELDVESDSKSAQGAAEAPLTPAEQAEVRAVIGEIVSKVETATHSIADDVESVRGGESDVTSINDSGDEGAADDDKAPQTPVESTAQADEPDQAEGSVEHDDSAANETKTAREIALALHTGLQSNLSELESLARDCTRAARSSKNDFSAILADLDRAQADFNRGMAASRTSLMTRLRTIFCTRPRNVVEGEAKQIFLAAHKKFEQLKQQATHANLGRNVKAFGAVGGAIGVYTPGAGLEPFISTAAGLCIGVAAGVVTTVYSMIRKAYGDRAAQAFQANLDAQNAQQRAAGSAEGGASDAH
jgi:hypothetical protein